MELMKYCRCGKQIPIKDKCCIGCKPYYDTQYAKYNRQYDTSNRVHADFYDCQEWKDLRTLVKQKYKGLDIYDYYTNHTITQAKTAHHIIELKEDYNKRLDIENLIPLSSTNHSKIHKMYFRNKKKTQQLLFELLEKARQDGLG